jgi:uncharacterized protein YecT (DUF1311 family)
MRASAAAFLAAALSACLIPDSALAAGGACEDPFGNGLVECADLETIVADHELHEAYEMADRMLDPDARVDLREVRKSWKEYRLDWCAFENGALAGKPGHREAVSSCFARMAREERAKILGRGACAAGTQCVASR